MQSLLKESDVQGDGSQSRFVLCVSSIVNCDTNASNLQSNEVSTTLKDVPAFVVPPQTMSTAPPVVTAAQSTESLVTYPSTSNRTKKLELKRLSDSDGYCAFANMPERREQKKILALCSSLEKAESARVTLDTVPRFAKKTIPETSGRSRMLKFRKKRILVLKRLCAKGKERTALKKRSISNGPMRNGKLVEGFCQGYTGVQSLLATSAGVLPSQIDPVVAASFDRNGSPTIDHVGRSSLHVAMGSTDETTLKFVVNIFKRNNMLACRDNSNVTPLYIACCVGNLKGAELLLLAGASPNEFCGDNGSTPLHEAVLRAELPMVQLLLNFGADITAKDKNGLTALQMKTSPEVDKHIHATYSCQSKAGIMKPIVGNKKLPTIFVLRMSSYASDMRPYVFQSELCGALGVSEDNFIERYKPNMISCTLRNSSIASRIINPFLKASFERAASAETSCLIEVDSFVRHLFNVPSNVFDVSGSAHPVLLTENLPSEDAEDTDHMTCDNCESEEEYVIRIDDMRETKLCLKRLELLEQSRISSDTQVSVSTQSLSSLTLSCNPSDKNRDGQDSEMLESVPNSDACQEVTSATPPACGLAALPEVDLDLDLEDASFLHTSASISRRKTHQLALRARTDTASWTFSQASGSKPSDSLQLANVLAIDTCSSPSVLTTTDGQLLLAQSASAVQWKKVLLSRTSLQPLPSSVPEPFQANSVLLPSKDLSRLSAGIFAYSGLVPAPAFEDEESHVVSGFMLMGRSSRDEVPTVRTSSANGQAAFSNVCAQQHQSSNVKVQTRTVLSPSASLSGLSPDMPEHTQRHTSAEPASPNRTSAPTVEPSTASHTHGAPTQMSQGAMESTKWLRYRRDSRPADIYLATGITPVSALSMLAVLRKSKP